MSTAAPAEVQAAAAGDSLSAVLRTRWEALKEKQVLKAADAIIVNTTLARQALVNDAPEFAVKVTTITNGFDPENFVLGPPPPRESATLSIVHAANEEITS